jgi:hypothetical protein
MFYARDVLDHARDILQDHDEDRYTNESLIRCLNAALTELRRLRPDFWIGRYYEASIAVTVETDEIQLPVFMFSPLVDFVAGRAELRDDEFTTDGRAVALMAMFKQAVGAGQ